MQLALTVKYSDASAERVLVPMRVCNREDFEQINAGMLYDVTSMALGSPEALACPDFSDVQLLGNMMLPSYEIV